MKYLRFIATVISGRRMIFMSICMFIDGVVAWSRDLRFRQPAAARKRSFLPQRPWRALGAFVCGVNQHSYVSDREARGTRVRNLFSIG